MIEQKQLKPFFTYTQQIDKLTEKKLRIDNTEDAIRLLKKYSYFSLIGGYKKPFKNKDGTYKKNTSINDIFLLYSFDKEMRNVILQYILIIEDNIKSLLAYNFCEKYGEAQQLYLDSNSYAYTSNYKTQIDELILILQKNIDRSKKHPYVHHQKMKYENVPLWVLMKTLTLGTVSKMYAFLPQTMQTTISKEFVGVDKTMLIQFLDLLTHARNICAHNERLFDYDFGRSIIDDTAYHSRLLLPKKGDVFLKGKRDLFAVIIVFKYLLDKVDFSRFIKDLENIITTFNTTTNQVPLSLLYRYMGFPDNWQEIGSISVK